MAKKGFIYLIKSLSAYKIGRVTDSWRKSEMWIKPISDERMNQYRLGPLRRRLKSYICHNPHDIELLGYTIVEDCDREEKLLLNRYKAFRLSGEWFSLGKNQVAEILKTLDKKI